MHQDGLYMLHVAFISLCMFFIDVYPSIECHSAHCTKKRGPCEIDNTSISLFE